MFVQKLNRKFSVFIRYFNNRYRFFITVNEKPEKNRETICKLNICCLNSKISEVELLELFGYFGVKFASNPKFLDEIEAKFCNRLDNTKKHIDEQMKQNKNEQILNEE